MLAEARWHTSSLGKSRPGMACHSRSARVSFGHDRFRQDLVKLLIIRQGKDYTVERGNKLLGLNMARLDWMRCGLAGLCPATQGKDRIKQNYPGVARLCQFEQDGARLIQARRFVYGKRTIWAGLRIIPLGMTRSGLSSQHKARVKSRLLPAALDWVRYGVTNSGLAR